jgi:hypothetical protein
MYSNGILGDLNMMLRINRRNAPLSMKQVMNIPLGMQKATQGMHLAQSKFALMEFLEKTSGTLELCHGLMVERSKLGC